MRTLRSLGAGAIVAVVVAVGLVGCTSGETPESDEPTIIRLGEVGQTGATQTFDPGAEGGSMIGANEWIQLAVYDTLFFRQDDGVHSRVATEWSYDDSRTNLSITLREDVVFTDGEVLDAAAVKANIDHIIASGNTPSTFLSAIQDVEVTGDFTLDVHLKAPDAGLLRFLGFFGIASPKALEDPATLATTPVGSGPYVLDAESSTDTEFTFERNPDYWDPESYPYDTVVVTLLPDITARVNALKSGQVDVAVLDPATAAEAKASGLVVQPYAGRWYGLVLGDKDGTLNPAIGDVRVRQAMNLVFDRELIVETLEFGYGVVNSQAFTEGQGEYLADRVDEYDYDLERARELMAEAGYADGFELTIPANSAFGTYQPIVEQSLADIGITVTWLEVPTGADLFGALQSGEYPVIMMTSGYVDTIRNYVRPGAIFNTWTYEDPEVVDLLSVVNIGTDEEVLEAEQRLGEIFLEDAYFVNVGQPSQILAMAEGVAVDPLLTTTIPLYNIRPTD